MFRKKSIREKRKQQLMRLACQCRTAEELVLLVEDYVGCPIHLREASDIPEGVPGMSLKNWSHFVIVYKPSSALSIQFTILHELVHIVLNHFYLAQLYFTRELKRPESIAAEMEIEAFAYELLILQNGLDAFLPVGENSSIAARYESLFH